MMVVCTKHRSKDGVTKDGINGIYIQRPHKHDICLESKNTKITKRKADKGKTSKAKATGQTQSTPPNQDR